MGVSHTTGEFKWRHPDRRKRISCSRERFKRPNTVWEYKGGEIDEFMFDEISHSIIDVTLYFIYFHYFLIFLILGIGFYFSHFCHFSHFICLKTIESC